MRPLAVNYIENNIIKSRKKKTNKTKIVLRYSSNCSLVSTTQGLGRVHLVN